MWVKVIKGKKFFLLFWLLIAMLIWFNSGGIFASETLTLDLNKSIELALENNLGYQISQTSAEIKEAQVEEAEGAKKTNLKLQGGYIRMSETPTPESLGEGDFSYLFSTGYGIPQISVSISKVLYSGGKFESLIKQAESAYSIALNDLEKKRQEIIYQVTQAYYGVLQAEGLKRVSEQAMTQIEAHWETSQTLLEVGMIAPIDLQRIKAQLSNLEHNLIRAENAYELAVYNLNSTLGIELDTKVQLQDVLFYEPCEIQLNEAVETAWQYRPEIKNLTPQKKITEEALDLAKSNKKPLVALNVEAGITGWQIAVMGEVPIFDGGISEAKIKQAELNCSQVDQNEKLLKQLIEFEVRSAYLKMKEAEKLIKVTEEGIENSRESFRIAQVKYNEGMATNTEVIDAQSALIEAETNHLNALYNYNINRAALIKAMGIDNIDHKE